MGYRVEFLPSALRELKRIRDRRLITRIHAALDALAANPRPPSSRKLSGENAWRVRVGDTRVIYQIEDDRLLVIVVRVRHRADAYRN